MSKNSNMKQIKQSVKMQFLNSHKILKENDTNSQKNSSFNIIKDSKSKIIKSEMLPPWLQPFDIKPKYVRSYGPNLSDFMSQKVKRNASMIISPPKIGSKLRNIFRETGENRRKNNPFDKLTN